MDDRETLKLAVEANTKAEVLGTFMREIASGVNSKLDKLTDKIDDMRKENTAQHESARHERDQQNLILRNGLTDLNDTVIKNNEAQKDYTDDQIEKLTDKFKKLALYLVSALGISGGSAFGLDKLFGIF